MRFFAGGPGRALLALGAASAVALCAWGASRNDVRPQRHVIVILLDAARPDRFSSYGYRRATTPNIDALADRGVVFMNHFSHETTTRGALPGLFFSRYFAKPLMPKSSSVSLRDPADLFRTPDRQSISLPAVFAAEGFRSAIISGHPWIKPGTTLAAEVDELHDLSDTARFARTWGHPPAEQVIDYAIDWISKQRGRDFFLYIHLMDTHFPHFLEADARDFLRDEGASSEGLEAPSVWTDRWEISNEEKRLLDALYDGSLKRTDRQLGRLFRSLEEMGLLDSGPIVITSDHGEYLFDLPGRVGHGGPWWDLLARVPLIVHFPPKLPPGRVVAMSSHVDVLPTLAGLLGLDLPEGAAPDGSDLFGSREGPARDSRFVYSGRAVRGERYKAMFDADPEEWLAVEDAGAHVPKPTGRLYDLIADPLETHDVWETFPEIGEAMFEQHRIALGAKYRRFVASTTDVQPTSAFAIGAESFEIQSMPDRWQHDVEWNRERLRGASGAEPIALEFPVPNGRYRVTANGEGHARIAVGGGGDVVDWVAANRESNHQLGAIVVSNRRFQATISPAGAAPIEIRRFGFVPISESTPRDPESDRRREQQLRILGYVD